MSNMGDMGDMGDMGNMGDMGGGAGVPLPFRSDLPFDKEDVQLWRKADNKWGWVKGTTDLEALPALPLDYWSPRDWSGKWSAWLILTEFTTTQPWKTIALSPFPTGGPALEREKDALFMAAQDERADAIGEIVAQNETYEDCITYFGGLLRFTSRTHGKTVKLMHVAGLVGILTSMHFKAQHRRPRPSQLWPALLPPIEVPGHPAFPSGHATQAMLMALILEQVLEGSKRAAATPLLHAMAHRIARNREIAGLHYASDSQGGQELAGEAYAMLAQCPQFTATLTEARAEWIPPA